MRLLSLIGSVALGAVAVAAAPSAAVAEDSTPTTFDGKPVPPLLELTPVNFDHEIQTSKFALVKHYSPYCHHCLRYAPVFQTLYEFYFTSAPPATPPSTGFSDYYGFKFASINCVAFSDLCVKNGVESYPTTVLYKDGKPVQTIQGVKDLPTLSTTIETILEENFPGTRPKSVTAPEPKATVRSTTAGADAKGAVHKSKKGTPVGPKAPPKPTGIPNTKGASVPLTAESFQTLVTMTQEPWFIKFYAPWCHHCQAMAPVWNQLAKEMQGKLHIGEVNCDKESRLCKDARLNGYPTVLFFRGGERVEYSGLRGLGDFVAYADKAIDVANGVPDVDLASFEALEQKEEVIFLYFYDFATTAEDFLALERLPLSLIGHAKLVKTNDPRLYERYKITTWPRLLVSREGRPTYYEPLTPNEMRDTRQVLNWMKSVWLPIVPEMMVSNAHEIMDGKLVVLGILKRDDKEGFASAIREMKSAASEWMDKQIQLFQLERQELRDAKQLRIEEAEDRNDQRALRAAKSIHVDMNRNSKKQVTFAWVDGVFWQRWLRTTYGIDVKDGERVVINDEDNRRYWDNTITGNPILPSRTSILETLNKVTASPPKIKPKLTISSIEKFFFDIRVTFSEHPYLTIGCFLGLSLGAASWFRGRLRRSGHFRLEDTLSLKELKLPMLGSGPTLNGKVD